MSNDHLHPVFQECLAPFAPPDDGGLQYAQTTEPEPKDAIEHLEIGGTSARPSFCAKPATCCWP